MKPSFRRSVTLLFTLGALATPLAAPAVAHAWGALGHRMVAETAAIVAADPGFSARFQKSAPDSRRDLIFDWGDFLKRHRFELGVYSFLPDSLFRHIDGENGKLEAPTHFFDIDLVPKSIALPESYAEVRKTLAPSLGEKKLGLLGSSPWRMAQFYRLAKDRLREFAAHQRNAPVRGGYQPNASAPELAEALYFAGVLAHYSGDNFMPYHAVADYNGVQAGETGIHFYFENDCIDTLEPGLSTQVLKQALEHQSAWQKEWSLGDGASVTTLAQRALRDSEKAVQAVSKIDLEKVVLKRSTTPDAGSPAPAQRQPPGKGCVFFEKILTERLAKASVFTAYLWRSAWKEVEPSPPLKVSGPEPIQFSEMLLQHPYVRPEYGPK